MTKISQYSTDVNITGNDKWIGSDAQNFLITKNFTPNNLADFFNGNNVIDIGTSIRYRYQTLLPGEAREQGTISFEAEVGPQVNFSDITTFLIAKNTLKGNTVTQYLDFLVDGKVLISKASNINTFGYYKITSIEPWIPNTNFFVVELEFLSGNGFIYEDLDYLVSLVDKVEGSTGAVWGSITGDIEDQTDLINYISSQIITPTLQEVTDVIPNGNRTTNEIFVQGVKIGRDGTNNINIGNTTSGIGTNVIAIGNYVGGANEGDNNIFIGSNVDNFASGGSGCIILGDSGYAEADNQFIISFRNPSVFDPYQWRFDTTDAIATDADGFNVLVKLRETDGIMAYLSDIPTLTSELTNDVPFLTQDNVVEYPDLASFPPTGVIGTVYIALDTGLFYSWNGTTYVLSSPPNTGITGVGTTNTLPKFTSPTAIGNSRFTDDGAIGRYGSISNYVEFITGANVFLKLYRGQSKMQFYLGNPLIFQESSIYSDNTYGTALETKGYLAFRTGATATTEGLRILSTGQLELPQTPATGTTSDFLLLRDSAGNLKQIVYPTIPTGTVTSVGLTMPTAFNVASSPITSSGTLTVTGAGLVSQYVRGDGTLANFPASTGGGASLSYYLNGSVSQGTFGGIAFREMDRTPILGAGTDFTINANGYIQSFITDAGVPNLLEIPAGNWNFETYFSASSGGGSPSFYVELYKWNGTTLSLIASNSATPENITGGTSIDLYVSALAVPQTTLLATDRLAVRIYVTHSGRTITLHTEDNHLCQVITTFSTGLTALNGLTAQVQNLAVGTSGTDFAISSASATHTFNLPTASATNRGALSSTDWSTFNGKQNALGFTPANKAGDTFTGAVTAPEISLTSTTKGFLPNAVTTTQRNAISSPTAGTMIFNTTEGYPEYFDTYWGWMPLYTSNEWKAKNGIEYFNDLTTTIGGDGILTAGTASGTVSYVTSSINNRPGLGVLSTSTSATGRAWIGQGVSATATIMRMGGGRIIYETSVRIPTLSDGTQRFQFLSGLSSTNNSTSISNGILFAYDEGGVSSGSAASANWQVATMSGISRTWTTTSVPVVANQWYKLTIEINDACTSVVFKIDGNIVKTETLTLPSATDIGLMTQIYKSIGTTARTAEVDYISFKQKFTTQR